MKPLVPLCAAALLAGGVLALGQQQLPEPRKQFGAGVTGAFEGWFVNKDGSRSFLVGYYNRNSQQTLDVSIGAGNRIEPGGPDMGQPTHFLPGRQYGMFVVPVPKTFGPDDRLTWTIVANGQSASIPLRLHPDYVIDPFTEIAVGNTPPAVRFEEKGTAIARADRAGQRGCSADGVAGVADDLDALGDRRHEVHERHRRAALQAEASGRRHLVEIPRAWRRRLRDGKTCGRRAV